MPGSSTPAVGKRRLRFGSLGSSPSKLSLSHQPPPPARSPGSSISTTDSAETCDTNARARRKQPPRTSDCIIRPLSRNLEDYSQQRSHISPSQYGSRNLSSLRTVRTLAPENAISVWRSATHKQTIVTHEPNRRKDPPGRQRRLRERRRLDECVRPPTEDPRTGRWPIDSLHIWMNQKQEPFPVHGRTWCGDFRRRDPWGKVWLLSQKSPSGCVRDAPALPYCTVSEACMIRR